MFQINPKIPETDALKHWYEDQGSSLHWMCLTQSSVMGGGTSSGDFSAGANMKTIMVCYDVILLPFKDTARVKVSLTIRGARFHCTANIKTYKSTFFPC